MPHIISVMIPSTIPWRVVYEKSLIGFSQQSEPKNKDLVKKLKKAVPKVVKKQLKGAVEYEYKLKQCYEFQRTRTGDTEQFIYSCYEGDLLTGGYHPRVTRYIEAIPRVGKVLASWQTVRWRWLMFDIRHQVIK